MGYLPGARLCTQSAAAGRSSLTAVELSVSIVLMDMTKRTATTAPAANTTKIGRFVADDDGAEMLGALLDAMHGDAWRVVGNGTMKAAN